MLYQPIQYPYLFSICVSVCLPVDSALFFHSNKLMMIASLLSLYLFFFNSFHLLNLFFAIFGSIQFIICVCVMKFRLLLFSISHLYCIYLIYPFKYLIHFIYEITGAPLQEFLNYNIYCVYSLFFVFLYCS